MNPVVTRTERDDDHATGDEPVAWDERPIFGTSAGLAWWGAILLGFGLTFLGVAIDQQLNEKAPTMVTQGAYFVACVAAVCWVRRGSLFGPMVQPPLILAVALIGLNIYRDGLPKDFDVKDFLLGYGVPVINSFPTMAVTTGVTLLVGVFRMFWQRDPDRAEAPDKTADDQPPKRRRPVVRDDVDADAADLAGAAAPTRAARPVAPPAGRPARAAATRTTRAAGRTTGENRLPGRSTGESRLPGAAGRSTGENRLPGERSRTTGENRLPGAEPRRGVAANRARPLEPGQRESAPRRRLPDGGAAARQPDSAARPRPQDSGPRPRPQDSGARARRQEPTLAPRPQPRAARREPTARPWEADPPARRAQPPTRNSGQLPRKPLPPTTRGEDPPVRRPARGEDPPPRRSTDRPPPPPRRRRWDVDDRG